MHVDTDNPNNVSPLLKWRRQGERGNSLKKKKNVLFKNLHLVANNHPPPPLNISSYAFV